MSACQNGSGLLCMRGERDRKPWQGEGKAMRRTCWEALTAATWRPARPRRCGGRGMRRFRPEPRPEKLGLDRREPVAGKGPVEEVLIRVARS